MKEKFIYHFSGIFKGKITASAGLVGIVFFVLIAIFAPLIAYQDPYDVLSLSVFDSLLPPMSTLSDGSISLLGTDAVGRDILSACMYGLRISLIVSIVAISVGSTIGVILGLLAAMKGGWVESLIMRAVDLKVSIPGLLLALLLLAFFGTGIDKTIYALIIGSWAGKSRLVRSVALSELKKEYMDAAKLGGMSNTRIMLKYLLPNSITPVLVMLPMSIAGAIIAEATLSFLGVGVPITEPSLGLLIANGNDYLLSGKWWISIFPGVVLLILVLCVNVVSDRVREYNNPYLNETR